MKDGMTLLRETCAAYGLEDVADDLWAWFSDPKCPTFNDIEATIQRLRTHPSYTAAITVGTAVSRQALVV